MQEIYYNMKVNCDVCKKKIQCKFLSYVNVKENPELAEEAKTGKLFTVPCSCRNKIQVIYPFLYEDPKNKFQIQLCDETHNKKYASKLHSSGKQEKTRIVNDIITFIEKCNIFENNLDDRILECMKLIIKRASIKELPEAENCRFIFTRKANEFYFLIEVSETSKFLYKIEKDEYLKFFDALIPIITLDDTALIIDEAWAVELLKKSSQKNNTFINLLTSPSYKTAQEQFFKTEYAFAKLKNNTINELDDDRKTLLYYAVMADNYNEVKELLEDGADPNIRMEQKRIVLHWAFQYQKSKEVIDLLLEYGADTAAQTIYKITPLEMIDSSVSADYLEHFLDRCVIYKKAEFMNKFARNAKHIDCIKLLLRNGYSLNTRAKNGMDANGEAILNNEDIDFLKEFFAIGGDPCACTESGRPYIFSKLFVPLKQRLNAYIKLINFIFKSGAGIREALINSIEN